MSETDDTPTERREGRAAESGVELKLTSTGLIQRIRGGQQLVESITERWLRQLEDDADTMQERAPEALARCRAMLLRLLQDDELHAERIKVAPAKLVAAEGGGGDMPIPPLPEFVGPEDEDEEDGDE